jgi:hypothetical protein
VCEGGGGGGGLAGKEGRKEEAEVGGSAGGRGRGRGTVFVPNSESNAEGSKWSEMMNGNLNFKQMLV